MRRTGAEFAAFRKGDEDWAAAVGENVRASAKNRREYSDWACDVCWFVWGRGRIGCVPFCLRRERWHIGCLSQLLDSQRVIECEGKEIRGLGDTACFAGRGVGRQYE